ncbi:universal stress protein [Pararhodobacter oceanensis]|uniref:Universal stress protein UspA n=1 Tax=Pararhodobacter oceanensis TaxID=2172121 RepID=A0A2T8HXN2_9RHOB|nr:universal stress protein [Pararhodobacter oceanensis]PVH30178.1 universal stress protein UspA [Pararhodobacter oceanensis]
MFNSILLPIDLADDATWKKALPAAINLAKANDARLHVVTVVPDFGMSIVGSYFDKGFEERAIRDIGHKMNEWVEAQVPQNVDVQPHVLHGRVYEQVIEAANRLGADAIVMGSHRPELKDYLLGPNAARVVRHATQSVFVVRGE